MRRWFVFAAALAVAGAAFAQSAGSLPSFEAADVHTSPRSTNFPRMSGPFYSPARWEVRYATMVDLIQTAYGVDPERVVDGPNWLELDRYDVIAKPPAGSTAESRKLMLQALLADRFKLVLHQDSRPMAAYRLSAGKSLNLTESTGGDPGCNFKMESPPPQQQAPTPPGTPAPPIQIPLLSYTCHNTTMAAFASALPAVPGAAAYFDNKPVVDASELKGAYDFTLKYTPKVPEGFNVTGEQFPLLEALDKQLGLSIELSRAPMPVMRVESVNEKPTENPSDVSKFLPPLPTEFEVAEIKPSAPVAAGGRGGAPAQPEIKNGRVIVPGITLKNLIQTAWDLNGNDDTLVGAPKWLDSDRFDIIAKAPAGVQVGDITAASNRSIAINIGALRPMLQSLLIARFKLVVHTEQRPMNGYSLVAVKPKMQKADPTARSKWTEGPADDSKDPRKTNPVLGRLATFHNVTMAQFAEMLPGMAPGYIHNEVVDATGLEGGWDFTLNFSAAGQLQGGGRGGDGAPQGPGNSIGASDPSGGLSLLDAVQKQIGLKLELQKRPFPVLVIDHVEQKPTEN